MRINGEDFEIEVVLMAGWTRPRVTVMVDGVRCWLSAHGRQRYRQRNGTHDDDAHIIVDCLDHPQAVWAREPGGYQLVTYLPDERYSYRESSR